MTTVEPPAVDLERRDGMAVRGMVLGWWAERQPDAAAVVSPRGRRTFGGIYKRLLRDRYRALEEAP